MNMENAMPPKTDELDAERQQRETQIARVHERIDEVLTKLDNMTSLLTYDAKGQLPGLLPRVKALEDQHEREKAEADAKTFRKWCFEMGTYVLKVLLAALALYIASSARKGMVQDIAKETSTSLLNIVSGTECDGCQVADSNRGRR